MSTFHTLTALMVNELFGLGRVWSNEREPSESIDLVVSSAAATVPDLDATCLAKLNLFASRVKREFGAMSDSFTRTAALVGTEENLQAVVGGFLQEHFTDLDETLGWTLWLDHDLRAELAGVFGQGLRSASEVQQIISELRTVYDLRMEEQAALTLPGLPGLPELPIPPAKPGETASPIRSSIGTFGPLAFEVSRQEVFTLREFSRKRQARFAEHAVVNAAARSQFMGMELWETSLRIQLSRNYTDPEERIRQLTEIQEAGEDHPLILGGRNLGSFTLRNFEERILRHGRGGEVELAEVSITLREFTKTEPVETKRRVRRSAAAPVRQLPPAKTIATNEWFGR